VNPKILYAAGGGIAAAAVAVFFLMGSINFRPQSQGEVEQVMDPELAIKSIEASPANDGKSADLKIAFDLRNPNKTTLILETIHYSIYVDDFRMTIGDIGTSPEGFLAGQPDVYTIVSGSTVTLRDTQEAERNELNAESWDEMVAGGAEYRIEGSYVYRVTGASLQTTAGERDFVLTFP
jgi:hypothetical protein